MNGKEVLHCVSVGRQIIESLVREYVAILLGLDTPEDAGSFFDLVEQSVRIDLERLHKATLVYLVVIYIGIIYFLRRIFLVLVISDRLKAGTLDLVQNPLRVLRVVRHDRLEYDELHDDCLHLLRGPGDSREDLGTRLHIVERLAESEVGHVLQQLVAPWVNLVLPLLVCCLLLTFSACLHVCQLLLVFLGQHRVELSLALYFIGEKLVALFDFSQLLDPLLLLDY